MKLFKYITTLLVAALSGCQNLNYEAPLAKMTLTNVSVEEDMASKRGKYSLTISFDYAFTNEPMSSDLYFCTVQFLEKIEGQSTSTINRLPEQCAFKDASGTVSFRWLTPFDSSNLPSEELSSLALPLQYFVAVHQKTSKSKSIVIARSETFTGGQQ